MGNTALPRVGDGPLQRLTQLIEDALNDLEGKPLTGVVVLAPIAFPAFPATVRVYHGLGRAPVGWLVVKNSAFISFADVTTPAETDQANYAVLACNLAATLTLAVF